MKKLIYTLLTCAAFTAQAQRRCGTMEHAAMRQQQDPSYNERMNAAENVIRQWIAEHPDATAKKFPVIEGFTPTGNVATDNANYAAAKKVLYATKAKTNATVIDQEHDQLLRERKRKANSFIKTVNN